MAANGHAGVARNRPLSRRRVEQPSTQISPSGVQIHEPRSIRLAGECRGDLLGLAAIDVDAEDLIFSREVDAAIGSPGRPVYGLAHYIIDVTIREDGEAI